MEATVQILAASVGFASRATKVMAVEQSYDSGMSDHEQPSANARLGFGALEADASASGGGGGSVLARSVATPVSNVPGEQPIWNGMPLATPAHTASQRASSVGGEGAHTEQVRAPPASRPQVV